MTELNLLDKTEFRIQGINLNDANLSRVEELVAEVLELRKEEVQVIDVKEEEIFLDIYRKSLEGEQFMGRGDELRKKLDSIPGVEVSQNTQFHSRGILGYIALSKSAVLT